MSKDLIDKKFDQLFKMLEEFPKRICDEFDSREERREIRIKKEAMEARKLPNALFKEEGTHERNN